MNVSCGECRSVFRVDPARIPATTVRARCSVCGAVIVIGSGSTARDDFSRPVDEFAHGHAGNVEQAAAPPVRAPRSSPAVMRAIQLPPSAPPSPAPGSPPPLVSPPPPTPTTPAAANQPAAAAPRFASPVRPTMPSAAAAIPPRPTTTPGGVPAPFARPSTSAPPPRSAGGSPTPFGSRPSFMAAARPPIVPTGKPAPAAPTLARLTPSTVQPPATPLAPRTPSTLPPPARSTSSIVCDAGATCPPDTR